MTHKINKHTATRKLTNGNSVSVTVENGTWEEHIHLDGSPTYRYRTHVVNNIEIKLLDINGKTFASGKEIRPMKEAKVLFFRNADQCQQAMDAGCVGMIGRAFLKPDTANMIAEAKAEAEAQAPKTAEQIKIENANAEAEAKAEAWRNSPEGIAAAKELEDYEKFVREMEAPDSDY